MAGTQPNPDEGSRQDRRGAFLMLFFALLAIGAGNTMLIAAVLPPLTRELGLPDWMAGAIFSLSAAIWVVMSPFWGRRSNRWGRRPVAALGLAGFSASMLFFGISAALALAGHITSAVTIFVCLLCARSLFGIFGSGTNPAAQAYVADRTSSSERTAEIASLSSGFSVGSVAGPAMAAAMVATFGLLSPVFFTAAAAAVMAFLIYTRLPEFTPPEGRPIEDPLEARGLWHDARILPYLVYAVGLSLVTAVLTQTYIFAVMDKMGVSGTDAAQFTGPAFSVGAMATLIAQLVLIPRLHFTNRQLMIAGALALAIGAILIVPTDDFAVLVLAQFMIGIGQGLARPGYSGGASLAVGSSLQGNVAGLVIAANGMGFIVSPFFGPWMYEFVDPAAPFVMSTVLMAAMGIYAWLQVEAPKQDHSGDDTDPDGGRDQDGDRP